MEENMTVNIPLDKTTPIICEECGNQTFQQGLLLRRVSRFLTFKPQDSIMPIATFICSKCGHANQEFLPQQPETSTDE